MGRRIVIAVRVVALLLVVGYAALAATSEPVAENAFSVDDEFLVIAHQGGDGLRPSNTMAAFENAVRLGVDVLEMDVHTTADGVLVVIHDASIDRTTDGTGRVQDYTFAALTQFDAGYDWPTLAEESARTDRPYRGQGITIPALDEVLRAFPEMRMIIEIKQKTPPIPSALCDLLREYDRTAITMVASFDGGAIRDFRQTCPEVVTSAVQDEILPFFALSTLGLSRAYHPVAAGFQVPEYASGLHVVTGQFVANAQAHNIVVQPWTINNAADMRRMLDLNVDGIITDYPDVLLEMIGRETPAN